MQSSHLKSLFWRTNWQAVYLVIDACARLCALVSARSAGCGDVLCALNSASADDCSWVRALLLARSITLCPNLSGGFQLQYEFVVVQKEKKNKKKIHTRLQSKYSRRTPSNCKRRSRYICAGNCSREATIAAGARSGLSLSRGITSWCWTLRIKVKRKQLFACAAAESAATLMALISCIAKATKRKMTTSC